MFTFFDVLSPLFFWLDIGALLSSTALLVASLLGLYFQVNFAVERLEPLSTVSAARQRKRAPRAPAEGIVEILDGEGQPIGAGRLLNLSAGGAGFLSLKNIPKGHPFMARFRFVRAATPVTVFARIVWSKSLPTGFIYGVQYGSTPQSIS